MFFIVVFYLFSLTVCSLCVRAAFVGISVCVRARVMYVCLEGGSAYVLYVRVCVCVCVCARALGRGVCVCEGECV